MRQQLTTAAIIFGNILLWFRYQWKFYQFTTIVSCFRAVPIFTVYFLWRR